MNKFVLKFYMWYTGETKEVIAVKFSLNHYVTRSKVKAYWYTLVD